MLSRRHRATRPNTSSLSHTLLFDSDRTGNYEVFRADTNGSVTQLTNNAAYDSWWAKPSPNGQQILFYRTPKGVHDTDYGQTSLWLMQADGSNQQQIIVNGANGWEIHGHGEWSPDGTRILMFAGTGGSLIVHTDTTGGDIQLVVTAGQIQDLDPSWSPDGQQVLYCYQGHVWRVPTIDSGGQPTQLTSDSFTDYDPYYSPDGGTIAFLTKVSDNPAPVGAWAIRMLDSDGSNLRDLINDGNVNSKPAWAPNSTDIYFHRHPKGSGDAYFGLWKIRADGSGLTALSVGPGNNEYPAVVS